MEYSTAMLTEETWPDFAALVTRSNGVWGGCWCIGFHPDGPRGKPDPTVSHQEAKHRHVRNGTNHQVLVYADGSAVGWCQFGRPAELPTILNPGAYARDASTPPDWRIGCVFVESRHRGHGVARAAVTTALDEIRRAGGGTVEAYPEQTVERKPQRGAYLHTGPEELFTQFGFVRDRRIAKWRWVMRATV
ncbi:MULTISPECIES: GNAT family N-acetyltransferase [Curtobacterium]|uniref:GNAT family N-acetyltransferase n=1 Tax=Curtobacterium TaxID=2034 RepID=UPI0005AC4011|nr:MULTISPECIES: GNAT family N-acetyltransferase [Curtobacterium]KIQ03525.1 GCN5 family acetyltransferase [Curtobacterium flaccumfaciens]MBT1620360.1 GNAT family N-acetyltransferase [Curtobacterium flaccumfaciens pv. poinsettiae]MCS6566340.1 GNAT family N-acetyltransferase [Curtobacterium flaccumfaciens pv. flaccumfaciens]MDD1383679.1 GNAT family N-acetyltransferase [Curtobacterium flaccumfaciens pv. poinsettiae]MDQ0540131.1 putative GNAT family acetyltransferase [Curtobacterium flaccumfaciens